MLDDGRDHATQLPQGASARDSGSKPGELYDAIREPYFFGYVRDELIAEYGAQHRALGRPQGLHDDRPALPAARREGDPRARSTSRTIPAAALVSINPRTGAIRAMAAVDPEPAEEPVQPALAGAAPAGLDLQDVRARGGGRAGDQPATRRTTSRRPFTTGRPGRELRRRHAGGASRPTTTRLLRLELRSQRHAPLGQHGLRAAHARRRRPRSVARRWRRRSACARSWTSRARTSRRSGSARSRCLPLDMASAYATLAAGGVYSEPMAIRRVVLADGKVDTDAGWGKPKRTRVISDGVAGDGDADPRAERPVRHRHGARASAGRRPARPARPRSTSDAWFAGYTPELATTVWVGYPRAEIPMTSVHGIAVDRRDLPGRRSGGSSWSRRSRASSPTAISRSRRCGRQWKPFTRGEYALDYDPTPA